MRGNLPASRSHCSLPAASCLLLLSCVFPTLPSRHWCVSECVRGFFFFFIALCFCNPEAKAGGWGGVGEESKGRGVLQKKKARKQLLDSQHMEKPGEHPASSDLGAPEGLPGFRASLSSSSVPLTSAGFRIRGVRAKSSPPEPYEGVSEWELGFLKKRQLSLVPRLR